MKKTKLFTSLAALALVLGLGACNGGSEEETTPDESEGTTQSSETTGETTEGGGTSEEGIVFGFELDGVLNAIDGGYLLKDDGSPYVYEFTYTSNLDDALKFTYEAGEAVGEYYISTEIEGVQTWVAIVTSGNYTNVNYVTDKTPLYWNPTYECWGNETQTHFLCQNSTFGCFYCSEITSWIDSSPIAGLYNLDGSKVTGFVGEVYQEPITDIPYFEVEEPEDGGQYYIGFPYTSGSTTDWYMFNGTTDSYGNYLQCSVLGYDDPTSAVLVKTTKNTDDTWGLTFTLNETEYTIYAWPNSSTKDGVTTQYGEITFIATTDLESAKENAVSAFSWDSERSTFTVTLNNGSWYFSTYQGKSSISLTGTDKTYDASHLYTANPEYIIPEEPQHEDSGIEYSSPTSFTANTIIAEYPEYTLGTGSNPDQTCQIEGKTTTLGEVSIAWGEGGTSGVRLWNDGSIRVYKGTTDTTFSVSEGHTLGNIVITTGSSDGFSALEVTGGTIASGGSNSWTITPTDATVKITLPSSGTNTYVNEFLVYYE